MTSKMKKIISVIAVLLFIVVIITVAVVGNDIKGSSNGKSSSKDKKSKDEVSTEEITYDVNDFLEENEKPVIHTFDNGVEAYFVDDVDLDKDDDETWNDIDLYIFSMDITAESTFKWLTENTLAEDSEIHENWASGYDTTANDITVKVFYYLTGNSIVEKIDYMSDPGVSDGKPSQQLEDYNEGRHKTIMKKW